MGDQVSEPEKAAAWLRWEISVNEETIRDKERDIETLQAMIASRRERIERLRTRLAELEQFQS